MVRSIARALSIVALALSQVGPAMAQTRSLDIYWVDVEGGAATLIVSPSGESLLFDSGWQVGDRDAKRIAAAAQQAGLKRIDYFILSHFHADHAGGIAALSKLLPIGKCFDRGDFIEPANQQWRDAYLSVCGATRTILHPGDKIPLKGVRVDVVASNGELLAKPLAGGGSNPLCAAAENKPPDVPENQLMVGALFTYGKFKFLDLADLDWEKEMELACPVNRVGQVTVWQAGRHGALDGAGSSRVSVCHQATGRRREQRTSERSGRSFAGPAESIHGALRTNRRDAGHRGYLAGPSVAAGSGSQHRRKHDRQSRGNGGLPGPLDEGLRRTGRTIHDDEQPERFPQNLRGALRRAEPFTSLRLRVRLKVRKITTLREDTHGPPRSTSRSRRTS